MAVKSAGPSYCKRSSILVCVQIWVRWTLPRLRIDQVMTTCLKYLIPISCFLFAGTVAYPLVLVKMSGKTSIIGSPAGERLVQPRPMRAAVSVDSKSLNPAEVQGSSAVAERSKP